MQYFHVVPIRAVALNATGPAVIGTASYSPNVTPATSAVELVTDTYFLQSTW